jgi:hypothetical protein
MGILVIERPKWADIVEKVRRTAKSAPTIESRSTAALFKEPGFTFRVFEERHSMQMPWAAATRTFSTISARNGTSAVRALHHGGDEPDAITQAIDRARAVPDSMFSSRVSV